MAVADDRKGNIVALPRQPIVRTMPQERYVELYPDPMLLRKPCGRERLLFMLAQILETHDVNLNGEQDEPVVRCYTLANSQPGYRWASAEAVNSMFNRLTETPFVTSVQVSRTLDMCVNVATAHALQNYHAWQLARLMPRIVTHALVVPDEEYGSKLLRLFVPRLDDGVTLAEVHSQVVRYLNSSLYDE